MNSRIRNVSLVACLSWPAFCAQAQEIPTWLTGGYVSADTVGGQAKVQSAYASMLDAGASANQSGVGFSVGAKISGQTFVEYVYQQSRSNVNQTFSTSPAFDHLKAKQTIATHAVLAVYRVPFGDRFSLDIRGGLAHNAQKFNVTSGNASPYDALVGTANSTVSASATGFAWGLSARYAISPRWSVTLGYLNLGAVGKYTGPQAPASATTPPKTDVTSQSLSLAYTF